MPELSVVHFSLIGLALAVGLVVGWLVRADRCAKEKIAVHASWQEQLESQQSEHNRLAEQNKGLMEQISQYQAAQKDYMNRAKELSASLKDAFARRDELQRQLKDMRGRAEVALAQRNQLREKLENAPKGQDAAIREKDDKIFKLSRELTSWQSRVPPLVERFQEKDREARELKKELEEVRARLQAMEERAPNDNTRIEPVDAGTLPDGGDASNEPLAMTAAHDIGDIQDAEVTRPAAHDGTAEPKAAARSYDESALADDGDEIVLDSELAAVLAEGEDNARDAGAQAEPGGDFDEVFAAAGTAIEESLEPGSPENGGDRDDLQKIKGIGPSIEQTLNDLGVFRFHQIAEMSESEIDRVAQQLKGFRSRIYREDWIGQARDLHFQKSRNRS